jgi:hypothetical protein
VWVAAIFHEVVGKNSQRMCYLRRQLKEVRYLGRAFHVEGAGDAKVLR